MYCIIYYIINRFHTSVTILNVLIFQFTSVNKYKTSVIVLLEFLKLQVTFFLL